MDSFAATPIDPFHFYRRFFFHSLEYFVFFSALFIINHSIERERCDLLPFFCCLHLPRYFPDFVCNDLMCILYSIAVDNRLSEKKALEICRQVVELVPFVLTAAPGIVSSRRFCCSNDSHVNFNI